MNMSIDFSKKIRNFWKKGSKSFSYLELVDKLNGDPDGIRLLDKMIQNYEILDVDGNGNYKLISKTSYKIGKYIAFKNGDGKIVSGDSEYAVFSERNMHAINGDIVLFDSVSHKKGVNIIKVLDRKVNILLGEVKKYGDSFFVIPDDSRYKNLTISLEDISYVEGEKVQVLLATRLNDNFYIGEIKKRIGYKDDPGVDILMEAYRYGIRDEFGPDVNSALELVPYEVSDSDKIGRMDYSKKMIFTIDGKHTKDRDDAISLEVLSNGNFWLGVHIADVSHYVKYDSAIDKEARLRGTSSYLANTVIPMLPHKLSNGICSLNENVDRLTISCMMEIDLNGNVVRSDIVPSYIKSSKEMNYDDVNSILEEGVVPSGYENYVDILRLMEKVSQLLRKKREMNNSIDFNNSELEVVCDDCGKISEFIVKSQRTAEKIIEDFMIVANSTVAKSMSNYPFIYRIHDSYREDKMTDFLNMLDAIGIKFNPMGDDVGKELAVFLKGNGTLGHFLETLLIRTFSKAVYDTKNIGHYGLGLEDYCHFTSPIRRYPDLMVHNLVKDFKLNMMNGDIDWSDVLTAIANHSSKMERNAAECERSVMLMKCAEYMEGHIGEVFNGTIISMNDKSIFVELDNMISGDVSIDTMTGSYYYDREQFVLFSHDGGDNYYLGDRLELLLVGANKNKRLIRFAIKSKISENRYLNSDVKKKVYSAKDSDMYYNVNKGVNKKRTKR